MQQQTDGDEDDRALLENARQLVSDLNADLRRHAQPFRAALNDYTRRKHAGRIDAAAEWLVSGSFDTTIRIWDLRTAKRTDTAQGPPLDLSAADIRTVYDKIFEEKS